MTTLSHSPGSGTVKSNPQGTDFSHHPSSMGNPSQASIPRPNAFVHAPEDQSCLLLPPGQLARSDPRLSPESEPELAVRLTGTARPTRPCVPLSRAQTLHPSSPTGTGSQPHCTALRPSSPGTPACRALPRRYPRGHGREKQYLGEAPRSSPSRPRSGRRAEGVGVSERAGL